MKKTLYELLEVDQKKKLGKNNEAKITLYNPLPLPKVTAIEEAKDLATLPLNELIGDLDNSTNNVLIPLDSWTSGLLVYRLPLSDYFRMDDPNLTMEEYIRLEEEKAHKRGKVFNWQTATYGKIRVDDDLHNLSSMEAEFPAIVINDADAPQDEL
ncbi:hypothetical protein Tco_0624885 [Tanacetum coccineum]|uniref:Uncharacterized protein n=1 Tax=Tanacetum coccineum TaxID=301880 RepID=A0ABQ4WF96_9ASTR